MKREVQSRWDRDPVLDKDGKPVVARITEKDVELFKLLERYTVLPADYLRAFLGGNQRAFSARLNLLYRSPNRYIDRPEQQRKNADANYRYLVYQLDDKGADHLRSLGCPVNRKKIKRNFAHELMVSEIAASIELGTREHPNVKLIQWRDILASDKVPTRTKEQANPATIPFVMEGEVHHLMADGDPFVLQPTEHQFMFFPGFEADCATEPLDAADTSRTSIRQKFRAYLHVMENRVYASHFGSSTFMVPFITTNETRMKSMMALLESMKPGQHARRFLFKHIPAFTSYEKPAPPTGHMLTEPWHRVGNTPFTLTNPNTSKEKAAA
ncbi:MAG: replication-relaxation family protein [Rhizobiales bacterium]|nr:replication-relaxation family protein [Hyphomicrobiales bacterium]